VSVVSGVSGVQIELDLYALQKLQFPIIFSITASSAKF